MSEGFDADPFDSGLIFGYYAKYENEQKEKIPLRNTGSDIKGARSSDALIHAGRAGK
jgi:hypothetical protein